MEHLASNCPVEHTIDLLQNKYQNLNMGGKMTKALYYHLGESLALHQHPLYRREHDREDLSALPSVRLLQQDIGRGRGGLMQVMRVWNHEMQEI